MGKNFRHNRAKTRDDYTPQGDPAALATELGALSLSERTAEILQKGGVKTARDLAARRMRDMYRIQNIGKKQCMEVKNALAAIGLDFRPDDAPTKEAQDAKPERPKQDKPQDDKARDRAADRGKKGRDERKSDKLGDRKKQQPNAHDRRQEQGKNKKKHDPYAGMSMYEIVYGKREPAPAVEKPTREPLPPDAIVKFNRKGKWGYRDRKGNVVIQPDYDDAFEFSEDLACVEKDGKNGYIDKNGNVVVDFKYDTATSFSDGLASVTIGEKSGYIDKEGNEVVPVRFDVATPFEDGRAIVREDGRWGVLDRKTLQVLWR